ncbi:MAG: dihydroneopterin aldolase family protein [Thermoplasmata archaeon]
MDDIASKYFNCSDRERAVFEAGIKLGTIYHQFIGTPLNVSSLDTLEKAIEESIKVQPFVYDVKVRIKREMIKKKKGIYKYQTLTGEMLDIELKIKYNNIIAACRMEYIKEMKYPLMYVEEIKEE